ncbi:hypothetical protein T459_15733 [Capsicum annuum]|uniref:Uncharacterized protein n=1 Tax=Capsicum annuum TaxID=4072 RepID=A0A2G2Z6Z3_CAPAN|nr:hypothetical protein FXO37_34056 [Capsicum annuum]PHT77681.1 hypothetical protein T459_15733 [Capsicum annuum]
MLPRTGAYCAGIQADPDGVQINVHYAFGTQYQHIFSLICHVQHSLMSFVLSHATIRIPDLGEKSFNLSLHLNVTAGGGYVEEIGLEDMPPIGLSKDRVFYYIGAHAKNIEMLFISFVGNSDLGPHNVLSLEIRDCSFGDKAGGQCCKAGDDTLSLDVFVVSTLWRVLAASSEVAKG